MEREDYFDRYRVIRRFVQRNHVFPSIRELMDLWGINSTSAVSHSLSVMETMGWVYRPNKGTGRSRAYVITGTKTTVPEFPEDINE
jgi:SOS-response transcriptional repressor LexA